ncbi:MAG TPA: hypothetical protein VN915_11540 [Elusimicrobiota bacterium]|nr:hypothetical protein [Elusimicrobiota bacterium]
MKTILCAALLLASGLARAQDSAADIAPLFQRGRVEVLAGGGYGLDDDRSYLILALGGGYYLRDGLSAGVTGEAWLGSRPQIYNMSPYARCVFLDSPWHYKPYAGVFYRRTSYASLSGPIDSMGLRGGLVFPLSGRAYLTGGLAFEHRFQDSPNVNLDRDLIYPELGLEFTF